MRLIASPFPIIFTLATALWSVPVLAQQPVLKVAGNDSAMVRLESFKVEVKVTGTIAITTMEMRFCNKANRVLEGELTFPMPEGVSISRYALDINGKMREAVPIEKEKGQVVFENIERRNVDPGLLEKTTGNTFRTRIYPIPANGCRTIIVGYQQQLTLTDQTAARYDLPLHFKAPIDNFNIDFKVFSSAVPELGKDCSDLLQFEKSNEVYNAHLSKKDYLPDANFSIVIPQWPDAADALTQQSDGKNYFYINSFPLIKPLAKPQPSSIGIVWDVSLSGLRRNQEQAFALLDAYFKKVPNLAVALTLVGFTTSPSGNFTISGGNWSALKERLNNLVYDGATNFGSLQSWPAADEYLFFSDGLSTYGNSGNMRLPGKPVHTINASPNADFAALKLIAGQTGGSFVNLQALPIDNALKMLTEQQLQFMGIAPNGAISDIYPLRGTPVAANCAITGISSAANTSITLLFGYGNQVLYQKTVALNSGVQNFISVEKLWAQQKIAALEQQYEQNKNTITELGKKYGLVTQNTSLIVLDAVEDYVRYEIEPPAELRGEYDKLMKERLVRRNENVAATLATAVTLYADLTKWWQTDFTPKPNQYRNRKKAKNTNVVSYSYNVVANEQIGSVAADVPPPAAAPQNEVRFTAPRVLADSAVRGDLQTVIGGRISGVQLTSGGAGNTTQVPSSGYINFGTTTQYYSINTNEEANKAMKLDDKEEAGTTVSMPLYDSLVSIENKLSEVAVTTVTTKKKKYYQKQLDSLSLGKDVYARYLAIREGHLMEPVFYFDVANKLFAQGDTAKGLLVLSNVADLGYDDHELYKMLGYQLKTLKQYDEEVNTFRKVLQWRPQEPQSYRDYALALADAGKYQQALDTLYLALTKQYDETLSEMYHGIEEIIVTEINNLIAKHGQGLNTSRIDKKLLRNLPVDMRVVLNWNMNDSDIDLWVIDPKGERCYYSNKQTAVGGRISDDFTQGYGPEQFMLRKAPHGKYKVMMNYFSDSQQKIAGPVTVMAEIYTHYGKPNQQRKTVAFQMKNEGGEEGVLISEFIF
jgi:Vault protein inter-alpha-trypsin domain/Uncharacterized protein conserved in bacteria (DUF2135)